MEGKNDKGKRQVIYQSFAEGGLDFVTLINLLHYLGFNVSWRKLISPTQRITFLGIELDSSAMCLRLLENKLNRLINLVNTFSKKASASKCQLQSLAGFLNFAC